MSLPCAFEGRLRLPVVQAPMFLASGVQLVIENCKAGIIGTFPSLNQRTSEGFETWLIEIKKALHQWESVSGKKAAPFGVNLIVHKSNPRLQQDLALCIKHEVPLVITSLGAAAELVDRVHAYGGLVFHDVINARHGKKAAEAGVDGLIAVANGAGGHAGTTNPIPLIAEIREFFDKTVLLSGCISNGNEVAAAQLLGADLAYMGTRFLATTEANVVSEYKQMLLDSASKDIVYTPKISGVNASFMRQSIIDAGIDPNDLTPKEYLDFGAELDVDAAKPSGEKNAWLDIWSAGQGVGSIHNVQPCADLVAQLAKEYEQAMEAQYKHYKLHFAHA
ncbi:nitronate monooxygenase family protein [Oceaniserpentilla sp. 4NH20-0058]|uniref:NAD(P)H-dependent flavin oxidoreductase n=1 Tax=Oceaniserpentilla sp. 4NH20-0058 TaxID=3127660 RepID=UPI00310A44FD